MKVSVIIPLYNKLPYLKKALLSVCTQSYADWECIVMDDGSTDGSGDLAEQLAKGLDTRIRVIHQSNGGVAAARNNAVAACSAELISFLDADDWWEPSFLAEMVRVAESSPEAGIWASNYIYYKPGKTRIGVTNLTYIDESKGIINYPKSYADGTGMPLTSISVMMRRSVFEEMGGFPLGVRLGEDFLLWSKIALRYPVAFLDKPLAYYNNDVPPALRATRNLHKPECNMLFQMDELEQKARNCANAADWKLLFDKLRINGLLEYWIDDQYHDCAAAELMRVDWTQFPVSSRKAYLKPIWQLKLKRKVMAVGCYYKQKMIKLLKI